MKVALVGAGWVATDRYLPILSRLRGVEIVGIVDRHHDRARHVAERFNSQGFLSVEEALDLRPDVLFVCTSPFSHAEIAEKAMHSGVHVFVEKPMAIDVQQAKGLVDSAQEFGVLLGVSHNLLFSRSVRAALDRIESGVLGEIRHLIAVQASSAARRLPHWYSDLPGGLFFDEAPHMIYLLERFAGGLRLEHAWARQKGPSDSYSALSAGFVGVDGQRAELTMIFDSPVSEWFISVVCEKGVEVIDLFRDIEFLIPPDGQHHPRQILRTSIAGLLGHGTGTVTTGIRYLTRRQFWGHDLIIGDFLDAVRTGRPPAVTGRDGARVVGLMTEVIAAI